MGHLIQDVGPESFQIIISDFTTTKSSFSHDESG